MLIPVYGIQAVEIVTDKSVEVRNTKGGKDFSVHLHTGYLTGEAVEYVYWPHEGGRKVSELIWKIDNIFMHGAGFSYKPLSWLAINADGWFNIFKGNSTMDDYDWLWPGMDWTHWSHHDKTDVTKGNIIDINVELTAFTKGSVSFSGILGFKRDNWQWKAYGGSCIYSDFNRPDIYFRDNIFPLSDNELSITYEQTFNVPYIGISMNGDFGDFDFNARLISSAFVYGEAVDHHHLRNLVIYDDFRGGKIIAFNIGWDYSFTERLALQNTLSYTKYGNMKGYLNWYDNDKGTLYTIKEGAGAILETTLFSLSLVFNL